MRWWLLLGLLGCVGSAPGSAEVEARRKGPFEGGFDVVAPEPTLGAEVELVLEVSAVVPAPGGQVRLEVPAGVVLVEGAARAPSRAWAAGEARRFRWVVRPEVREERVVIARVEGAESGQTVAGTFGATFYPAAPQGRSEVGPEGRRRVVRVPAR